MAQQWYRWIWVLLFGLTTAGFADEYNPLDVEVECSCAYMIDLTTGRVLYSKNCHQKIFPASTTKMATALLSYRKLRSRLDEVVNIQKEMIGAISTEKKIASNYSTPAHWIEFGSSHMGLKIAEQMRIRDLLMGCLIVSANDACNALALTSCAKYETFMSELNSMVRQLGCKHTHFINAHGLYHPQQVTTVYDLVLIAKALLQEEFLRDVVSQSVYKRPKTNKQEPALMHNTNLLLRKGKYFCPGACGVKTGKTKQSGASFVAYAKNEHRQVLVGLSGTTNLLTTFEDAKKLLQAALNEVKKESFFYAAGAKLSQMRSVTGAKGKLEVKVKDQLKIAVYSSEEGSFKGVIHWQNLVPPVKKGHYVGKIDIVAEDGSIAASSALLAANDLEPSLTFQLRHWFQQYTLLSVISALTAIGIIGAVLGRIART